MPVADKSGHLTARAKAESDNVPLTIRTKLIVYSAVPVIILYLVLLVLGTGYLNDRLERDAKTLINEHARHQAARLALVMTQTTTLAESLGDLLIADPGQSQELLYAHLIDGLRRTPRVRAAAVQLDDMTRSAIMRRSTATGRPLQTHERLDRAPGWHTLGDVVGFSRAIYQAGARVGASWVELGVEDLYDEVHEPHAPAIHLTIRTADGVLLQPPQWPGHGDLPIDVQNQTPAANAITTVALAGGVNYWLANARLPGFPWSVTAIIPARTALADARREVLLLAAALLLSLVTIVVIIGTVARQITRPLVALDDAVGRVAQGDFQVAPEVHSDDELGRLAKAISRMARHIADREQLLRESHQVLEDRVAERTSALQESNARLLQQIDATRQTQEALRRATEQAQRANRAKSEFLSNMSHELRTPLHGVLGYTQILRRDQQIAGSQRDNVQAIERCGQHLLTLINDILDLTRIEAGEMRVEYQATHLPQLIDDVYTIIAQRAAQKGLTLSREIAPEVPREIETDPVRLRQILLNLLSNAVKFTARGSVVLSVSSESDGLISFAVQDSGIGIPEDKLGAIFDAFQQASDGQAIDGTGLGLAINQRLIHLLGGEPLKVESTPGKGSRFSFRLPAGNVAQQPSSATMVELYRGDRRLAPDSSCSVLVIEHGIDDRERLGALLRHLGCTVHMAEDYEQAARQLADRTLDLVMLDVRLPQESLAGDVNRLRNASPFGEPRVVAVSANVWGNADEAVLDAGFDGFLGKPYSERELRALLETLVGARFCARETDSQDATVSPWPAELAVSTAARIESAIAVGDVASLFQLAEDLAEASEAPQADVERLALMARVFDFDGLRQFTERLRAHT
ncbi:MAG: HAMP domain-containing protein [Gammaproteobacteria bacterium]|nr:HAMP domain-containing protein [Gammaproteobacteria bacterium]